MAKDSLIISNLRGGVNNSDPAHAIPDDQVTVGTNVEWITSMLGERRSGGVEINTSSSGLTGHDRAAFIYNHIPTSDVGDAELWVLGVTGTSSSTLCRKTTAWTTVTPTDAITIT